MASHSERISSPSMEISLKSCSSAIMVTLNFVVKHIIGVISVILITVIRD